MWFVYLLECHDDSIYTGITTDVKKRMHVHASGKGSKYVARKGFKRLLYSLEAEDKSGAAQLEYKIKQLRRDDKITFFLKHPKLCYSILSKQEDL
jgi:putative endonuclease